MTSNGKISGVIFDLDGVMIDSEGLSFDVWRAMLAQRGKEITDELYAAMIGMSSLPSAQMVIDETGVQLSPAEMIKEHWDGLIDVVRSVGKPEEGLMDLLNALKQLQLPIAVASNSPTRYVHSVLETLRVESFLDYVVCADQLSRGKPDPEIYFTAANGLGLKASHCLAIEDSPPGMQAALAAGMRCVVIPNKRLPNANFSSAFARFCSLRDLHDSLPNILGSIEA